MRCRRRDELEPAFLLELPECADEVAAERVVELEETREPLAPVFDDRKQMRIVSVAHLALGFVARFESLLEELAQLALEHRARELIRENRRDAERDRRGDFLFRERLKRIDQRQVRVYRRLRDPVAAVWPATVIQDVWKMAVQREYEIHSVLVLGVGGGERATIQLNVALGRAVPREVASHRFVHARTPRFPVVIALQCRARRHRRMRSA